MSFTFTVSGMERTPLMWAALQSAAGFPLEAVDPWPPDVPIRGTVHLYRPGVSARTVEVTPGDAQVTVNEFTLSSWADHELALAVLEAAAAGREAPAVEPDDDVAVAIGELRDVYGRAWAARQLAFGAGAVARIIDESPHSIVSLHGPVRVFLLGDRLLGELRAAGPSEALGERLIEAMRRTQWPGQCYVANVMTVSGGPPGKRVRLAVLSSHSRTLLPDVEAVALRDMAGGQLYVPPATVARLLPEHARYLDERHLLVEAVDEARWSELLARAAPDAVDLDRL